MEDISNFLNSIPVLLAFLIIFIVGFIIMAPIIVLVERYPKQFWGTLAVIFIIIGFILKVVLLFMIILILFFGALIKLNNN